MCSSSSASTPLRHISTRSAMRTATPTCGTALAYTGKGQPQWLGSTLSLDQIRKRLMGRMSFRLFRHKGGPTEGSCSKEAWSPITLESFRKVLNI